MTGNGNNVVWGLDSDFEQSLLLVNTIGPTSGQQFLGIFDEVPTGLEVQAGGAWEVSISPIARVLPPQTGDDFYVPIIDTTGIYDPDASRELTFPGPAAILINTESRTAEVVARGEGNNAIWIASALVGEIDLLMNEIDAFEGTVRLPDCSMTCYLNITGTDFTIVIP